MYLLGHLLLGETVVTSVVSFHYHHITGLCVTIFRCVLVVCVDLLLAKVIIACEVIAFQAPVVNSLRICHSDGWKLIVAYCHHTSSF